MSELKVTCAITGKEFTLSEREQELRSKFGLKNILPKLSPLERMRSLLSHQIVHGLWKNKCVESGESILSMYPASARVPVMKDEIWQSDQFDASVYGREIDWSRPLMEQYGELYVTVPRSNRANVNCENCDFSNNMGDCKDCYYTFNVGECEGVHFSDSGEYGQDCIDCYIFYHCELCHHLVYGDGCYNCGYGVYCFNSVDSLGCVDCRSVKNCLLCWGLRQGQYQYKNEQLSEEDYKAKLAEYTSDRAGWERLEKEMLEIAARHEYSVNINLEDSSGAYLKNSKDCQRCYGIWNSESSMNCLWCSQLKDCLDCAYFGLTTELAAASVVVGSDVYNCLGCTWCYYGARDLVYCEYCCLGIHDCLLSVGLNKKQHYSILNKQYTEEEYNELKPRVIAKLIEEGVYGEPLPINWAANPYNYSNAQDLLPLSREEVENRGLRWADPEDMVAVERAEVAGDEIVQPEDVEKLNGKIMKCVRTGRPFKLIAAELNLYAKHGLPLPRLHPDERYQDRVKQVESLTSVFG